MITTGWAIAGLIALVVLVPLIYLEGRRQRRKLRSRGERSGSGRGGDMVGVGMLELQKHFQPDRKVEIVQRELKHEDRVDSVRRPSPSGGDSGAVDDT